MKEKESKECRKGNGRNEDGKGKKKQELKKDLRKDEKKGRGDNKMV